ncbi:sensor histidine kinase [Nocardioides dongxiaopingii]|uniref:sensor histidine kinase n=1 Tax=Nocardioides dongxiaopingii TaxID=2576036 RepID=UPI0010C770DA|nr:sensor histidine kinase [Nocardioides dongxiaopingii]
MVERTARWSGPAAVAVLLAAGVLLSDRPVGLAVAVAVAAVATCLVVARLRLTEWAAVAALLPVVGLVYLLAAGSSANLGWFSVCVVVGWVALTSGPAPTAALTVVTLAGFVAQGLLEPEPGWGTWCAGVLFTALACQMASRQRVLLAELRAAQAGLAERAAAEERNRIAHELHDVIGHALTVSLLHVTSARLALDEDPAEAAVSLAEAERLARRSLAEVRSVVGSMQDAGPAGPLPGVGQLDELVASFVRAGADVDWSVTGDPTPLTATEGLTLYRILQEALTNVVRHAPGAPVTARLEVGAGRSRVVVDSRAPAGVTTADGTGLDGMRQRAAALGGELTAGPHEGGWRVEAVLPA